MKSGFRYIKWFSQIGISDISLVGGKNASLGEMYQVLASKGIKIPNGFALTAEAYYYFIEDNKLKQKIDDLVSKLKVDDLESLQRTGREIRQMILKGEIPEDLKSEIVEAYHILSEDNPSLVDVAVRSSATAEDLPDASFAGQQETYLNVEGNAALLEACRKCFASIFTDRAILYRNSKGFSITEIGLSVGVQKMVRSDLGVSGVMFTIDTESGFQDLIDINASYGLGENIVKGSVNPDEFHVFKPTLKNGYKPIFRRTLGSKEFKLIYDTGGNKMVKNVPVPTKDRESFSISDIDILQLSQWGIIIEDHYSIKSGKPVPMDIEWAKDGRTGELFILQARPETVQSTRKNDELIQYQLKEKGRKLLEGKSIGQKISTGIVRVIRDVKDLDLLKQGEILVADKTDPDWEPIMKKASAIITNRGGRTCHAAIVSREHGVTAIVGTECGTEILSTGQEVTVSCAEGDLGYVYEGKLNFEVHKTSLTTIPKIKTKIMMNIGNPEEVFKLSFLPNQGVGLARLEFIINSTIGIHPMALVDYENQERDLKEKIDKLTANYTEKSQFFIDKLADGVATIAAAFYPKDVIVRFSDFKSNEYRNLIGGIKYEPVEENPMLGFRGASRYYNPRYQRCFALECEAIKKVRDQMGFANLKVMIPFCRTIDEGKKVIQELKNNGLVQGVNGLEVYVMCEIPSNVILADEFLEIFDGFSIGSNDLTQLILGVDRESEIVSSIFDENNQAVKKILHLAIQAAKRKNKKIGICGQAPSDYPKFAEYLVREGIDTISLNPDVVLKTTLNIAEIEKAF